MCNEVIKGFDIYIEQATSQKHAIFNMEELEQWGINAARHNKGEVWASEELLGISHLLFKMTSIAFLQQPLS